ncbi:hypothetical protein ABRT01_16060 [Lentibacillus sp. L22]|uniref:hypothetical protein n=1 Tax=Lentibacillus sp. L22 TaxID=3163028 RepID=UPI003465ABD1
MKDIEKQVGIINITFVPNKMIKQYFVYLALLVWSLYIFTCSATLMTITIININGMKYSEESLINSEISQYTFVKKNNAA